MAATTHLHKTISALFFFEPLDIALSKSLALTSRTAHCGTLLGSKAEISSTSRALLDSSSLLAVSYEGGLWPRREHKASQIVFTDGGAVTYERISVRWPFVSALTPLAARAMQESFSSPSRSSSWASTPSFGWYLNSMSSAKLTVPSPSQSALLSIVGAITPATVATRCNSAAETQPSPSTSTLWKIRTTRCIASRASSEIFPAPNMASMCSLSACCRPSAACSPAPPAADSHSMNSFMVIVPSPCTSIVVRSLWTSASVMFGSRRLRPTRSSSSLTAPSQLVSNSSNMPMALLTASLPPFSCTSRGCARTPKASRNRRSRDSSSALVISSSADWSAMLSLFPALLEILDSAWPASRMRGVKAPLQGASPAAPGRGPGQQLESSAESTSACSQKKSSTFLKMLSAGFQ
mmetsp:Transcript_16378/g.46477  ORF Transcript_16378/g.46477 Transcript_16378/m.46477 type:complete len:408 (+) Transcript_16378:851-2074(+)